MTPVAIILVGFFLCWIIGDGLDRIRQAIDRKNH